MRCASVLLLGLAACATSPVQRAPPIAVAATPPFAEAPAAENRAPAAVHADYDPEVVSVAALFGLPPATRPGECFALLRRAAQYETRGERMLVSAYARMETTPARYETVEEDVMVRPERYRVTVLEPAEYREVEKDVVVKPAGFRKELVEPATYTTVKEEVLVQPARVEWRRGRGPLEKVDGATGEILCRVEIPAEFKTVSRQVLERLARYKRVAVPAETEKRLVKEVVKPARVRKTLIPAVYERRPVQKLVEPERVIPVTVPEHYVERPTEVKVREAGFEWQPVLCETNTTPELKKDVQAALAAHGYDPGPVDGKLGGKSWIALRAFQSEQKLVSGSLTLETLRALGVFPAAAP